MSTAGWFTLAVFALVLGLVALRLNARGMEAAGRAPRTGGRGASRGRRRWAAGMEWEFLDNEPVLTTRWRYGTVHQGGPGVARDLVTGSVLTDEGRRLVYVFDHEQAGRVTTSVVAVQRRGTLAGALELRKPSAPLPDDAGLHLVEPVGEWYSFATDVDLIKPLITHRLVRAIDAVGDEVELLWAEDSWVLCTAPLDTPPDRLQDLLDHLVEVAAALDGSAKGNPPPASGGAPGSGGAARPGAAPDTSAAPDPDAAPGREDAPGNGAPAPDRAPSDRGRPDRDHSGRDHPDRDHPDRDHPDREHQETDRRAETPDRDRR